tara:strand:- start:1338 stop:1646 length:309 start_codon:yes stop_codon:yes gene_type:complete
MTPTHYKFHRSLITIVYDYELKKDTMLKHDKWFENDNKIYELYLKKGDNVELIYKEHDKGANYFVRRGKYKIEVLNVEADMYEVKERNRLGINDINNYKLLR